MEWAKIADEHNILIEGFNGYDVLYVFYLIGKSNLIHTS